MGARARTTKRGPVLVHARRLCLDRNVLVGDGAVLHEHTPGHASEMCGHELLAVDCHGSWFFSSVRSPCPYLLSTRLLR